jgi:hypothetical protein
MKKRTIEDLNREVSEALKTEVEFLESIEMAPDEVEDALEGTGVKLDYIPNPTISHVAYNSDAGTVSYLTGSGPEYTPLAVIVQDDEGEVIRTKLM